MSDDERDSDQRADEDVFGDALEKAGGAAAVSQFASGLREATLPEMPIMSGRIPEPAPVVTVLTKVPEVKLTPAQEWLKTAKADFGSVPSTFVAEMVEFLPADQQKHHLRLLPAAGFSYDGYRSWAALIRSQCEMIRQAQDMALLEKHRARIEALRVQFDQLGDRLNTTAQRMEAASDPLRTLMAHQDTEYQQVIAVLLERVKLVTPTGTVALSRNEATSLSRLAPGALRQAFLGSIGDDDSLVIAALQGLL